MVLVEPPICVCYNGIEVTEALLHDANVITAEFLCGFYAKPRPPYASKAFCGTSILLTAFKIRCMTLAYEFP